MCQKLSELFPHLSSQKNQNLIYFDSAATTHKPQIVINTISDFYIHNNSTIHRSNHQLGASATSLFELARQDISDFIGAKKKSEIIFTSGATEGVNLIAHSFGKSFIKEGDVILTSEIEHHSNTLPWSILAKEVGAHIKTIPLNSDYSVDLNQLEKVLDSSVKILAIHHVSNVTGVIQDIRKIVAKAHRLDIPVFVDGAQAPAHIDVNVSELDCDFYCFSGHKLFGPTGVGVLFVKDPFLNTLPPFKTGGQMVHSVSLDSPKWSEPPLKFEAGTPNIAGVMGLHAAVKFLKDYGINNILEKEQNLTKKMLSILENVPNLIHYGRTEKNNVPIFSFNIKNTHHSDINTLLSENNVLIRSGHLCNQGFMNYLNISGCLRVSLSFYNTVEEINYFGSTLIRVLKFLKK